MKKIFWLLGFLIEGESGVSLLFVNAKTKYSANGGGAIGYRMAFGNM